MMKKFFNVVFVFATTFLGVDSAFCEWGMTEDISRAGQFKEGWVCKGCVGSTCYKFTDWMANSMAWNAKSMCETYGMRLITPTSQEESTLVKALLEEAPFFGSNDFAWIGFGKETGVWKGMDGYTEMTYSEWIGTSANALSTFVAVYILDSMGQFGWGSRKGTEYGKYVCEYNRPPSVSPTTSPTISPTISPMANRMFFWHCCTNSYEECLSECRQVRGAWQWTCDSNLMIKTQYPYEMGCKN